MMERERSIDTLARYMMYTAVAVVILAICWFFRDVIVYMLAAGLVSLIGRPIMTFFNRLKIKGKGLPSWIYAILTLIIVIGLFLAVLATIIPIIAGIAKDISMVNVESAAMSIAVPLRELNDFLIHLRSCPECRDELEINFIVIEGINILDEERSDYDLSKAYNRSIQASERYIGFKKSLLTLRYIVDTLLFWTVLTIGYFYLFTIYGLRL